ncbi:MAG TPA: hypothetical protein VHU91_07095 [Mycobacteriales bacterium]|jgi:hypothetical protein|nr:hypothetical protein [Mycobacteriales bacterium]
MVATMLPTGFFAGEFYTDSKAEDPEFYDVLLGKEMLRLDDATYAVWALAHGNPEQLAAGGESNRLSLVSAARDVGLEDIDQQLSDLQELGLLVQVLPVGNQLKKFAQAHCVMPLAMGLGNARHDLDRVRIGHPDNFRIAVPAVAYNIWLYSDRYESLWGVCEQLATQLNKDNSQVTPDKLLTEFLTVLPAMIAVSAAYIDRR